LGEIDADFFCTDARFIAGLGDCLDEVGMLIDDLVERLPLAAQVGVALDGFAVEVVDCFVLDVGDGVLRRKVGGVEGDAAVLDSRGPGLAGLGIDSVGIVDDVDSIRQVTELGFDRGADYSTSNTYRLVFSPFRQGL
jgi:hypothetical protein